MSYKCRHELSVIDSDVTLEDVVRELRERNGGEPQWNVDWYDVLNGYPINWEGQEEEMLEISRKWPEAVFALDILGEDQMRATREFYQNGRTYEVEPEALPQFDPSRLA